MAVVAEGLPLNYKLPYLIIGMICAEVYFYRRYKAKFDVKIDSNNTRCVSIALVPEYSGAVGSRNQLVCKTFVEFKNIIDIFAR